MTTVERKVSVSLDADLVAELERGDEAVSAQVNEAIRAQLDRRRRRRQLDDMLAELDVQDGKVDEVLVQKYLDILS